MNNSIPFYNLYCINAHCVASIFQNNAEIKVVFDSENLGSTHICGKCRRQLYSDMDIEIEQITAMAGVKTIDIPYYGSNFKIC